mmetsp:Transcript_8533/g.19983  ORF Transcript_8533/g.19983 Transcript_8533/m.19983 type:complete len:147 (+) Transcript_8533:306-746(+)
MEKHVHFSLLATVTVVAKHTPKDDISYSIDDYRTFRKQALKDVASYHRERSKLCHNPDAVSIVGLENFLCKDVFERATVARATHRRAILEAQRRLRMLQEGGVERQLCYGEIHQFILREVSTKNSAESRQRASEIGMRLQFDVTSR